MHGRWWKITMNNGICNERSFITFGSLWISITSISIHFKWLYKVIFGGHLPSLEDDERWWKMTYGHWKMCWKVLNHHWIAFDTHNLNLRSFSYNGLPSMWHVTWHVMWQDMTWHWCDMTWHETWHVMWHVMWHVAGHVILHDIPPPLYPSVTWHVQ